MDRVNRILNHTLFIEHLRANEQAEKDRVFCKHDMVHFLDVARIGMILNLEEKINLPKDMIYGAALLHDMGKHLQYEKGIPHEVASARIAPDILRDCGFDEGEVHGIVDAIRTHRQPEIADQKNLNGLLYRADKASRACFACRVEADCNWKGEKKNLKIRY